MSRYRLNPGAYAVAGVAVSLFGIGYLVQAPVVYVAAVVMLGVLVQAAWFDAPAPQLRLSPVLRTRVGGSVTLSVTARNTGTRQLPPASVRLDAPGLTEVTVGLPRLRPGQEHTEQRTVAGLHRAGADEVEATLEQWSLFRVASRISTLQLPTRLRVHPAPAPATDLTSLAADGAEQLSRQPGTEPDTVREWVPGDSRRGIQWRATARHGRLIVADRREARQEALQLVVLGQFCKNAEQSIAAVTTALTQAARRGDQVRCLSFDQGGRARLVTAGTPVTIGDWAAQLGDGRPEPLRPPSAADVVQHLAPGGSALVLALPDAPAGLLDDLRGAYHVVPLRANGAER